MRADTVSSINKRPKGSESPNSFLDQEGRRHGSITDYDKLNPGRPTDAGMMQPRMREHKPSRGQCHTTGISLKSSNGCLNPIFASNLQVNLGRCRCLWMHVSPWLIPTPSPGHRQGKVWTHVHLGWKSVCVFVLFV